MPPTGKEGYCSPALSALLLNRKESLEMRFAVVPENGKNRCEKKESRKQLTAQEESYDGVV